MSPFRPENLETDWDDKLGKPSLVIPLHFEVVWPKRTEKPETDWEDKPGKPRIVIGGGGGGVSICKKPLFFLSGCVQPRYKGKNMYTALALALEL